MAGGLKISDIINQGKKPAPVKDLHPVVSLEEAQKIIYKNLVTASEGIISNGYYMKLIRDKGLYQEAGFADVWSWAFATYGISKSTASRWMTLNDKYSIEGNSPYIQDRFKGFGKSQLQEMLYLTDVQMEQVEEGMTVKEIREIRKPEEVAELIVATSQQHESSWFVKKYFDGRTLIIDRIARIFETYEKNIERAKKIQELVSPYGALGGGGGGFSYDFRSFVKGVDFEDEITRQKIHFSYKELATLINEIYGPFEYVKPIEVAVATSQQDSCDGKCFNCDRADCNSSQEPRERCVLDAEFFCTTTHAAKLLKEDDPDFYKAYCVGCCNACIVSDRCGYSCNRPHYVEKKRQQEQEAKEAYPEMKTLDEEIHVEQVECEVVEDTSMEPVVATSQQRAKYDSVLVLAMLMEAKKLYGDMKNAGYEANEDSMKRQQVRVDALGLLYAECEGGDSYEESR